MDGVTAVANVLKMEGVDWIAVMPSNPLIEAAAIAGIRPVFAGRSAPASTWPTDSPRITNGRKTGIFLAQNGPGAETPSAGLPKPTPTSVAYPGAARAGVARNRIGVEPNFHPVRAYESITKWSAHVNFADRVPELMRQAFTKLRSGNPARCCWKFRPTCPPTKSAKRILTTSRPCPCASPPTRPPSPARPADSGPRNAR